ncbi:MAG: hypothetical protein KC426_03725 [Oceanospirillaceae bacterium]|nr:hypothetical protein [Oceanospirillaceae bacterium]
MRSNSLSGKELKRLSVVLNERIASLSWLFGFSSAQWVKNANREKGELLIQHSLMIRMLLERPELSPIPKVPLMHEVYDLLVAIDPSLTHNKMATIVGLSTKSTKRIFGDGAPTSTVGHMLLIIKNELTRLKTKQERREFYHFLQNNIKSEAESRGYDPDKVLNELGWTINAKPSDLQS